MNKKGIVFLVIVALIILGAVIAYLQIPKFQEIISYVGIGEKEIETKLVMGVGYGTQPDAEMAVRQAYEKMKAQLGGEEPVFVILTSTVGYNQDKILRAVNQLLPNTKIYGYTSLMGIMTGDGFHIGEGVEEGQVVSLMGFATEAMTFGVGACSLDEVISSEEAGRVAITRAIENAGKNLNQKPKIVLMSTSPFGIGEEMVIKGVESVLGKDVPLAGGGVAAGYSDLASGGEALFANNRVYPRGVVVTPIYTDLKIGHAFLAGFNPSGDRGTVTKFSRNGGCNIIEINNSPAAEVYNQWLDGLFDKYLGTSDMLLGEAVSYTFGKKVVETGGFSNWQMIVPFHFNPDGSITVGAVAEEGTELYLLESNSELFIQRPALTVRLARSRGEISEKEIAGVIMDQCGGTLLGITEGLPGWNRMVSLIGPAAGGAPFLGVSNLGPYGHFLGTGNRYGEVTASVIVFSKD